MKLIKSNISSKQLVEDLNLIMNDQSNYTIIEEGFSIEPNSINICFNTYDPNMIRELLKESGYYKTNSNYIVGKNNGESSVISLKDIIYIEGINNDTFIHTEINEFSTKLKLYELEGVLIHKLFVRISKSYIVSIHHIDKIKPTFNGKLRLIMDDGTQLEVTRHYISSFREKLGM